MSWHCAKCGCEVPRNAVSRNEIHSVTAGGCGHPVYWERYGKIPEHEKDPAIAIDRWNRKWLPGTDVMVDGINFAGKTVSEACLRNGEAKVYVDGLIGPVPLCRVEPVVTDVCP